MLKKRDFSQIKTRIATLRERFAMKPDIPEYVEAVELFTESINAFITLERLLPISPLLTPPAVRFAEQIRMLEASFNIELLQENYKLKEELLSLRKLCALPMIPVRLSDGRPVCDDCRSIQKPLYDCAGCSMKEQVKNG